MSVKQFRREVSKAKVVYAGVVLCTEDITYIQVVKADVLYQTSTWPENTPLNYRVDADGSLYIN
jgi:hypothetical protein